MKTGRYRVRRGLFGRSVLQYESDSPTLIGGYAASDVRQLVWFDVLFSELADIRFQPIPEEASNV